MYWNKQLTFYNRRDIVEVNAVTCHQINKKLDENSG